MMTSLFRSCQSIDMPLFAPVGTVAVASEAGALKTAVVPLERWGTALMSYRAGL